MVLSPQKSQTLMQPLVTTAAILGIIQGLIWMALSLTSIILYHDGIDVTSAEHLGIYIYGMYLAKDVDLSGTDFIIGPAQFSYFMYLYEVLSLAWFAISCFVLWVVLKGKTDKYYDGSICGWVIDASLVSLLDLILLFLLAHDYNKLIGLSVQAELVEPLQLQIVAVGVVMTFAARGFVLWVINFIFIVILGKHWYQKRNQIVPRNQSAIDAFSTGSRLPPWQENDNKSFVKDDTLPYSSPTTPQYQYIEDRYPGNDTDKKKGRGIPQANLKKPNNSWLNGNQNRDSNMPQSRSYIEQDSFRPYGQPAPPRTAKIGRQGGQRSPPLNVASPYIPDPDYSPPNSPRVRGVLRPNSNYVMF